MTTRLNKPSLKVNIKPASLKKSRSGMILAFAVVILVLMSLMGIVILSNTSTGLSITSNAKQTREAFHSADSCARLVTLLTLALLDPRTSDINDIFAHSTPSGANAPLDISLQPKFNVADLISSGVNNFDFTKRYLETGAGAGAMDPHVIFSVNGRQIAQAVVNLETYSLIPEGMGLGTGDPFDSSGGPKLQVGLVVSVTARTNESSTTAANPEDPTSIVTIMYRNYIN
jgi:hypothetical protein